MLTNIVGTQNVIDARTPAAFTRVLFTSSDKAVNPTNVMGTSKLMCERLMTAANAHRHPATRCSPPRASGTCSDRAGRWCRYS
jgi:FlaA1/EpsC-like NDP-sugar epimerase